MPNWEHLEYTIRKSNSGKTFAVYDVGFCTSGGRVMMVKLHGGFRSFDSAEEWLSKNIKK